MCPCVQALSAPGIGLVLSERLMGMPKEIAGPLHQALFDEIAWATEDEVREPLAQRRAVVKSRVDPFLFPHTLLPASRRRRRRLHSNARRPSQLHKLLLLILTQSMARMMARGTAADTGAPGQFQVPRIHNYHPRAHRHRRRRRREAAQEKGEQRLQHKRWWSELLEAPRGPHLHETGGRGFPPVLRLELHRADAACE